MNNPFACPLCGGEYSDTYSTDTVAVVKCGDCDHMWIPMISDCLPGDLVDDSPEPIHDIREVPNPDLDQIDISVFKEDEPVPSEELRYLYESAIHPDETVTGYRYNE